MLFVNLYCIFIAVCRKGEIEYFSTGKNAAKCPNDFQSFCPKQEGQGEFVLSWVKVPSDKPKDGQCRCKS